MHMYRGNVSFLIFFLKHVIVRPHHEIIRATPIAHLPINSSRSSSNSSYTFISDRILADFSFRQR